MRSLPFASWRSEASALSRAMAREQARKSPLAEIPFRKRRRVIDGMVGNMGAFMKVERDFGGVS